MLSGNVIKVSAKGEYPRPAARITKQVRDAKAEAAHILSRAQDHAARCAVEAESAGNEIFKQNANLGYAAGLEHWNEALAEAWKRRDDYLRRNEAELVKLAVAVAAQIVGGSARADTGMVLRTVRKALKASAGGLRITLKVNPCEEEYVRERLAELGGLDGARIVAAGVDAVEAGGCVVESELGSVDARLSTQLAALEKILVRRADASRR